MLLSLILLIVSSSLPFPQEVQQAYAQQDSNTLRTLLDRASSRADSLLVRYRLYPLTEDASLIEDLPSDLDDATARERALLSGLWSYRAGEGSMIKAIQYGRRATTLLEAAKEADPNDPYVLLVEGQSLLFRPAIAGKDVEAAATAFEELASKTTSADGISSLEAHVWHWLALREADKTEEASALQERLVDRNPPPLYRQFLKDPPKV